MNSLVSPDLEDEIGAGWKLGVGLDAFEGLAGDGEQNVRGQSLVVGESKRCFIRTDSSAFRFGHGEVDPVPQCRQEARSHQVLVRRVNRLNSLGHLVIVRSGASLTHKFGIGVLSILVTL